MKESLQRLKVRKHPIRLDFGAQSLLAGGRKTENWNELSNWGTNSQPARTAETLKACTPEKPVLRAQTTPKPRSTATSHQGCPGFRQFQVSQVSVTKFQIRGGFTRSRMHSNDLGIEIREILRARDNQRISSGQKFSSTTLTHVPPHAPEKLGWLDQISAAGKTSNRRPKLLS
ncbi:unnamed protein product [Prunus brigantina]